jgi:hypothetical protein
MTTTASRPTLYQNCSGQLPFSTINPEKVPPATVPRRIIDEYTEKHLPLSCKKKASTMKFAPTVNGISNNYRIAPMKMYL